MKSTLDNQMAQVNANKRNAQMEKAKDKELMDMQTQMRDEREKQLNEYKRQQRDLYKKALDEQVR